MMKRQYIITERAHFMCPNMHFGMQVELPAEYDRDKVKETLNRMAKAHPFLRSVISYDADGTRLYYDVKDASMVSFVERESMDTMWVWLGAGLVSLICALWVFLLRRRKTQSTVKES